MKLNKAWETRSAALKGEDFELDGDGNIARSDKNARLLVEVWRDALMDSGYVVAAMLVNIVVLPRLED